MNRLEIEQRSEDCVDISDDLSTVKIRNAAQASESAQVRLPAVLG